MKEPVIWGFFALTILCLTILSTVSYADSSAPGNEPLATLDSLLSNPSQMPANEMLHGLREELYFEVPGITVADLTNSPKFPNLPDSTRLVSAFETTTNLADNYGVRLSGFLVPPDTGDYVFYVCSDDQSVLFLSTSTSPANKVLIASDSSWSFSREWTTGHGQPSTDKISAPIPLIGGQMYYVEALMKEGGGGDYLGVAWKRPGGPVPNLGDPPIPGEYLRCRNLTNLNLAPTVTMVQPTNGAQWAAYEPIYLGAVASDRDGWVTSLAFYANNQKLGDGTLLPILNSLNEYYGLTWTNPAPGTYLLTAIAEDNFGLKSTSAPVRITVLGHDNQPTVTVAATRPFAYAGGQSSETNSGVFTFSRRGLLDSPLLISFAISGTASNGIDYRFITNVVSIPAGKTNAEVLVFPYEIIALGAFVPSNKTVTVSLLPDQWRTIPYGIGFPSNATVTIIYRDIILTNLPVVTISAPDPAASENPGDSATFRIFRTGSTNHALAVYYRAGGTASNGVDYPYLPGVLNIPVGRLSSDIVVWPIDDTLKEITETIEIRLIQPEVIIMDANIQIGPPISPDYMVGEPSVATAHINDYGFISNNLPPQVTLIQPTNGTVFRAPTNIILRAGVGDTDGWVQYVQFYAGNNRLGTITNVEVPHMHHTNLITYLWSNAPAGSFQLKAVAVDNLGLSATSAPVTITVSASASELTLVSPTNGTVFQAPANIWVQATAVDPHGYIDRVEFYAGTNLIGVSELVFFRAPFPGEVLYHSIEWNNVEAGHYMLTARALDTLRQTVVSAPISIGVQPRANLFQVKRVLPSAYRSGVKLTVKLETTAPTGDHAFALEDQPPAGWAVSSISHDGIFDAQNHKVKYGPFFNAGTVPKLLTYDLTPPSQETGTKTFTGQASMDGMVYPISGQSAISRLQLLTHPADINPTNYSISMIEVTAYVQAWLKGRLWPVDPNPIPAAYVTKAISLWRNGEAYQFNPSLEAPQCWVSRTNLAPTFVAASVVEDSPQGNGLAIRSMPESVRPGGSETVTLTMLLNARTQAYVVEEQIPAGWLAAEVNEGGQFDETASLVKWAFLEGAARPLSYRIIAPPNAGGLVQLQGSVVAAIDDDSQEIKIGGKTEINVTQEARVEKALVIERVPSAAAQISLTLVPGREYSLEASADLVTWTPLTTLVPSVASCHFVDNDTQPSVQRFYRVKAVNAR